MWVRDEAGIHEQPLSNSVKDKNQTTTHRALAVSISPDDAVLQNLEIS